MVVIRSSENEEMARLMNSECKESSVGMGDIVKENVGTICPDWVFLIKIFTFNM